MGESGEGNGYALQYSCLDNPVDRGAWWAAVHGVAQSRTWLKWLRMHVGEGNGNPLQCFCLENPGDTGAWWAAVYGVAQSQIWLKWLSSSSSSMGETVWANSGGEGWGRNTHTHTHTHTCRVTSWCSKTCDGGDRAVMYQKGQLYQSLRSSDVLSVSKFSVENPVYKYYIVTFMYSTKHQ